MVSSWQNSLYVGREIFLLLTAVDIGLYMRGVMQLQPNRARACRQLQLSCAGTNLWAPSPELQQLALNFLPTFLSRHPSKQRLPFSRYCPRSSWDLYVAHVFSLTLPLRQCIRPFTTNKTLSEPLYTVIGPFYPSPRGPSVGGFGSAWSAPALTAINCTCTTVQSVFYVFIRSETEVAVFRLNVYQVYLCRS